MIEKKFNKFSENVYIKIFLVSIFAFLHGALYFYPDWIQNLASNETSTYFSFHHDTFFANSDEITYGTSIRRIFDFLDYGFLNLQNPTSFNADSSINLQILPYIFGGFLSYILGSVDNFFYLKNFIFPIIGFLISFILLKIFFKSFFLSLLVLYYYTILTLLY